MAHQIHQDGIRFNYPENWQLDRQETDTGWTVALQSPGTAFFMVSFDPSLPDLEQMAQAALEALREEYKDVDAEEKVETVAGQPAVGFNLSFISLDLTNTGWARSFYASSGSVLLYWQATDTELAGILPVLEAIAASVVVEDD